ncbi:MAG: GNAT family N-acetyltransferase [Cyanobacteria bacterium SBLK]|nr:GNAT family N-acetyltransferase [Cyanobacteria bacterium SBLK]
MQSIAIARESPTNPAPRELIAELDCYLAQLYPPESNHNLNPEALEGDGSYFFVARRGDRAVGCAALVSGKLGVAEIKSVWVRQSDRGLGIATQLLNVLIQFAKDSHLHTLQLETGRKQVASIKLYEKFGFYAIAPFNGYSADPFSCFYEKMI